MKYVIYFQPRSGSTNLATRLNYPESGYVNGFEILSPQTALQLSLVKQKELKNFPASVKSKIIERFFDLYKDKHTIGFKVAPYQIRDDLPGIFQQSQKLCDKMVFLYRANFVRVAISQIWSLERGKQRLGAKLANGETDTVLKMHIEEGLFDYYLKDSILERDTILSLSRLHDDKLVISYEELYAKSDENHEIVFDFLGIDKTTALPGSDLIRIHSDDLSNHIVNFDEVVGWIRRYGCDESFLISTPGSSDSNFIKRALDFKVSSDALPIKKPSGKSSVRITSPRPVAKSTAASNEILALVKRASVAETYSASLLKDLKRAQQVNKVMGEERNEEMKAAKQHAAALSRQAALAGAYNQDLLNEQEKLKKGLKIERSTRERERAEAQAQLAKAVERAERAETYHQALLEEPSKLKQGLEAERRARGREREEAQAQLTKAVERAERAEAYHRALLEEQAKLRQGLEAEQKARAKERAEAQAQLAETVERAERAEAYHQALLEEQSKLKHGFEAERKAREKERAEAQAQLAETAERAKRAEAYHKVLLEESAKLKQRLEAERTSQASEQDIDNRTGRH
jgi:hypothetical protein